MRRRAFQLLVGLWSAYALGFSTPNALAQVPHLIRYQGQAMDSQGVPLEGPYTLTLRLYNAETAGTKLWEEVQTNVPLTGGHFSILLGQVTPLDSMDWSAPCWLSVQVNTEPELTPRQRITSVPLAIRAETAEVVKTSGLTDGASRLMPAGAIILWSGASCPAGYTRLSAMDGKFLVSGSAFNPAAGGSNTHDHGGATGSHTLTTAEIPPHTHGLRGHNSGGGSGPNWFPNLGDPVYTTTESGGGGAGHTHTIGPADSRPEFATVLLCQKD